MKRYSQEFILELGSQPNWSSTLSRIESNCKGKISYEEFVIAASDKIALLSKEQNLKLAFQILDINGDGKITADELKVSFSKVEVPEFLKRHSSTEFNEQFWDEVIDEIDTD